MLCQGIRRTVWGFLWPKQLEKNEDNQINASDPEILTGTSNNGLGGDTDLVKLLKT